MACVYTSSSVADETLSGGVKTNGKARLSQRSQISLSVCERDDSIKSRCSERVRFSPAPDVVFEYVDDWDTRYEDSDGNYFEASVSAITGPPASSLDGVVRIRACLARRSKADTADISANGEKRTKRRRQLRRKSLW